MKFKGLQSKSQCKCDDIHSKYECEGKRFLLISDVRIRSLSRSDFDLFRVRFFSPKYRSNFIQLNICLIGQSNLLKDQFFLSFPEGLVAEIISFPSTHSIPFFSSIIHFILLILQLKLASQNEEKGGH